MGVLQAAVLSLIQDVEASALVVCTVGPTGNLTRKHIFTEGETERRISNTIQLNGSVKLKDVTVLFFSHSDVLDIHGILKLHRHLPHLTDVIGSLPFFLSTSCAFCSQTKVQTFNIYSLISKLYSNNVLVLLHATDSMSY